MKHELYPFPEMNVSISRQPRIGAPKDFDYFIHGPRSRQSVRLYPQRRYSPEVDAAYVGITTDQWFELLDFCIAHKNLMSS